MTKALKIINNIVEKLYENSYGNTENIEKSQKEFFSIQKELFDTFKEIYKDITKEDFNNNINNSQIKTREDSVLALNEEIEYYSDCDAPSTLEYAETMAILTEIANNMAHIIESNIKSKKLFKNREINSIKSSLYDIKNICISKIARNALNKEDEGIIIGKKTDDTKSVNNNVFILDLPRFGQLSWHYNSDKNDFIDDSLIPNYKYKIQKGVEDSRETTLNSKLLLGQGHVNDLNIHNKVVREIPFEHENELKKALDIYYDILNNKDEYATFESKLRDACIRHGMPSKETFNMILDNVMDTMYGRMNYEKEELKKWRDNIEEHGKK